MSHISGTTGSINHSFTIPATSSTYDSTPVFIRRQITGTQDTFSDVLEIIVVVHTLPASATVELEVLKPGTDSSSDANWFVVSSISSTGVQAVVTLFASGVRIRGKSGGTGGACNISAFWYY